MRRGPEQRRSPATLVAVVALVLALTGTAFAAAGLTGKQKRQVGKIATRVFNKRIGGASVAHASSADSATAANTANSAKTAISAKTATSADSAKTADTAKNADKLGGVAASGYQRAIAGACPKNGAYGAIGSEGGAACIIPVTPIVMNGAEGQVAPVTDVGAGLRLVAVCHDGGQVKMVFENLGSSSGTLNWLYSNGTAVSASGTTVASGGSEAFSYIAARLEGQFIWSVGPQVVTVNLHAYDNSGAKTCEVRGTAEGATA